MRNDARSPADHAGSDALLNGPVGPLRNPRAEKNGTGGWWASARSFTRTASVRSLASSDPETRRNVSVPSAFASSETTAGSAGVTDTASPATVAARRTVSRANSATPTTGASARLDTPPAGGGFLLQVAVAFTRSSSPATVVVTANSPRGASVHSTPSSTPVVPTRSPSMVIGTLTAEPSCVTLTRSGPPG